jgi:DNA processing protein
VRLGVSLDFQARDIRRLWETLELSDEQLIAALGGRKREELGEWHASADAQPGHTPGSTPDGPTHRPGGGVERVCRHLDDYPDALRADRLAPPELHVAGGVGRLKKLLDGPAVAIVGARCCTDYGMEVARCLGRDLAAAGVCVVGELCEGISYGAHLGAAQAGGGCVAVVAGGLDRCSPRSCAALYRRVTATGCAVSELPGGTRSRLWSQAGRLRIVGLLAQVTILVEAERGSRELASARLTAERGRTVAAVPGRITSRASCGTNGLLKEGAALVSEAREALDLLYGSIPAGTAPTVETDRPVLDRRLDALLRRIGEGKDTISALGAERESPDAILRGLAELELKGLVRRGDGGRYVACAVASGG